MASILLLAAGGLLVLLGLAGVANAYHVAQWHVYATSNHPSTGYSIEEVEGIRPSARQVRLARLGWGVAGLLGVALVWVALT